MESIEEKQSFLRSEIIDKDYDPDEFFNFLSSVKEGDVQLEDWRMDELKKVVNKFQINKASFTESNPNLMSSIPSDSNTGNNDNNQQNEENTFNNNNYDMDNNNNNNNYDMNNNNNNNNNYEDKMNSLDYTELDNNLSKNKNLENQDVQNENPENQNQQNPNEQEKKTTPENTTATMNKLSQNPFEDFSMYFNCKKFEDSEIIEKDDLRIIVSDPVLKKGGLFSWSYYQYTISTPDFNYKVERKLTDFDWLYKKMQEIYPALIISSVPARHVNMKDNSEKKMVYLNFFMNSLSHYKFIRATPIFQFFISLPLDQFENKKKEYELIHIPSQFKDFSNLEGNISVIITEKRDKKALSLKNEILKKTNAFNKLTSSFDLVLAAFENCKIAMKSLSDNFKNLSQFYLSNKGFSEKLIRLSDITEKWSVGYKEQNDFFQKEIRYFFKFMEKELNDSLKVYDDFKLSRDAYILKYNKMKKMKNISKDEFLNLDILHKYYGYYLSTYLNEYDNLNKRHEERMNIQFIKYCNETDIFIQDYNTFISLLNFNN